MVSSPKPIYLVVGDAFMRKAEADPLLAQIQKTFSGNCEIQSFDAGEALASQILTTARSLPFLAEAQILRVRQAEKLKEDALNELEVYLKNPFAKTCLMFESDKVDEKSRLTKLVQSFGAVIRPAAGEKIKREVQFLKARLAESKKTITSGAQKKLFEMCGESPIFLASMVDRLILFSGESSEVNESMTAQFEENWNEVRVFDLSNAILARDSAQALYVFNQLCEMEDDIYMVLGFIHSQVKKLWQAKILSQEGSAPSQIAARLGIKSSFVAGNFFRALEGFDLMTLEKAIDDLHQLDVQSKRGRAVGKAGLEMWLLKLTTSATPAFQRGRSRS